MQEFTLFLKREVPKENSEQETEKCRNRIKINYQGFYSTNSFNGLISWKVKPGYSLVGGFDIDITGEYNAAGNPNAAHGLWDTQHEELQAEDTAFLQYDMLNDLCYFAQKAENYKTGKQ